MTFVYLLHKMSNTAYHRVEVGRVTGIYTTWSAAKEQGDDFLGECHEGFEILAGCVSFLLANNRRTEGNMKVFGRRSAQYSLRVWKRKQEITEIEQAFVKPPVSTSGDTSTRGTYVEPVRHAKYKCLNQPSRSKMPTV